VTPVADFDARAAFIVERCRETRSVTAPDAMIAEFRAEMGPYVIKRHGFTEVIEAQALIASRPPR